MTNIYTLQPVHQPAPATTDVRAARRRERKRRHVPGHLRKLAAVLEYGGGGDDRLQGALLRLLAGHLETGAS